MIEIQDLQELQLDALREVASIGAGHAATALSQMTGARIMISVPQLQIVRLEEVPRLVGRPDEVVATVLMHMLGDVTGRTLLVLPEPAALRLAERLLRRPQGAMVDFGELEQSALKETGNILCAAYLNALSDFMGLMLLLSVPGLVIDRCGAILTSTYIDFAQAQDHVFSIETRFTLDEGDPVAGHFLLMPDLPSLQVILEAIRLA